MNGSETDGPFCFHIQRIFTPVCTTELGYMAGLKPEFEKRNCKILGLSIDAVSDHTEWAKDIEETQGHAVNYPIIGDTDLSVAKLFDMIHPNAKGKEKHRSERPSTTQRCVRCSSSGRTRPSN